MNYTACRCKNVTGVSYGVACPCPASVPSYPAPFISPFIPCLLALASQLSSTSSFIPVSVLHLPTSSLLYSPCSLILLLLSPISAPHLSPASLVFFPCSPPSPFYSSFSNLHSLLPTLSCLSFSAFLQLLLYLCLHSLPSPPASQLYPPRSSPPPFMCVTALPTPLLLSRSRGGGHDRSLRL